jgi:hypothetical protein
MGTRGRIKDIYPPHNANDPAAAKQARRQACITGPDALLHPPEPYWPSYCAYGSYIPIEATAQARLIAWLNDEAKEPGNAFGIDGSTAPRSISPDIQWEVNWVPGSEAKRVDIVVYDADEGTPARLIELKGAWNRADALNEADSTEEIAQRQLNGYVAEFPKEAGQAATKFVFPKEYKDTFTLIRKCKLADGSGAGELERTYEVASDSDYPGVVTIEERGNAKCGEQVLLLNEEPRDEPTFVDEMQVAISSHVTGGCPEVDPEKIQAALSAAGKAMVEGPISADGVVLAYSINDKPEIFEAVMDYFDKFFQADDAADQLESIQLVCPGDGSVAVSHGDPHLSTFDHLAYDLQGVGEFHLAEAPEHSVDVQVRYVPVGNSMSVAGRTAFMLNGFRVEITSGGYIFVDGSRKTLPSGGMAYFNGGASIIRLDERFYVFWPAVSGPRPVMRIAGKSVALRMPKGWSTRGLMGNNNDDPSDDIALANGTRLTTPVPAPVIHGSYADSWRVSADQSLFTYEDGTSTASFTDRNFPANVVTLADFSEAEIANASVTCDAAGVVPGPQFEDCIYDLVLTGDARYAEAAAEITDVLIDAAARDFDDTGRLTEDFEGSVSTNFAGSRYSSDPSTTRVVGPLFDSPGYSFYVRNLARHDSMRLGLDLFAYGPIGTDTLSQSVDLLVDGKVVGSATFDGDAPELSGLLTGTIARISAGQTADGRPYSRYHLEGSLTHSISSLDVKLQPHNFKGIYNTSIAIDNIGLEISAPEMQHFGLSIPSSVSTGSPALGAGILETPGAADEYTFDIASGDENLIVTTGVCELRYTLRNQAREIVAPSENSCGLVRFVDLPHGRYTLETWTSSGRTQTYSMQLASLGDLPATALEIDGPSISSTFAAGQNRTLTFAGTGGRVRVTLPTSIYKYDQLLTITAPNGTKVFERNYTGAGATWIIESTQTGTYQILLDPQASVTGSTSTKVESG